MSEPVLSWQSQAAWWSVVAVVVLLAVTTLVQVVRSERLSVVQKLDWGLVVVALPVLGSVLFLTSTRRRAPRPPSAAASTHRP